MSAISRFQSIQARYPDLSDAGNTICSTRAVMIPKGTSPLALRCLKLKGTNAQVAEATKRIVASAEKDATILKENGAVLEDNEGYQYELVTPTIIQPQHVVEQMKTTVTLPEGTTPAENGFQMVGSSKEQINEKTKEIEELAKNQPTVLTKGQKNVYTDDLGNRYVYSKKAEGTTPKQNCISRLFTNIWKCFVNALKGFINLIFCRSEKTIEPPFEYTQKSQFKTDYVIRKGQGIIKS